MQFFNNSNNYIPPPNPIGGNTMPVGMAGYNTPPINNNMGGYYTNNYGYYNPYLEEERKKQEEIKRKEEIRQQCDVMKMISISASKCSGSSYDEQRLEEIYAPKFEEDIPKELKEQLYLLENYYNPSEYNPVDAIYLAQSRVYEYRQSLVPKDCDLYEFMDKSINLVDDILKREEREKNAENLAKLYNKQGYRDLVGTTNGDYENYYSSMYDNNDPMNTSIDDVETKLPPYRESENERARRDFMQKVFSQIEQRNASGYK